MVIQPSLITKFLTATLASSVNALIHVLSFSSYATKLRTAWYWQTRAAGYMWNRIPRYARLRQYFHVSRH